MNAIMTVSWIAFIARILLYLVDQKYELDKCAGNFSRFKAFITVIITVISLPANMAFVLLASMIPPTIFFLILDSCSSGQVHSSSGSEDPAYENYDGCNYSGIGC